MITIVEIARKMWEAYSERAGGVTYDGKPLPTWDELGTERQLCWAAAAMAARDAIGKAEDKA